MTPLHQLLIEAIAIAKQREPGLSDSLIAYRAGITQPTLSRAKRRCGPSTLEAVLDALGLELALVAPPAHRAKATQRAQSPRSQKSRAARGVGPARNARAARGKKGKIKNIKNIKSPRRSGATTLIAHATSHTYARGSVRRRGPTRRNSR